MIRAVTTCRPTRRRFLKRVGGVDCADVFGGLHQIGYQGYVTVHQAFAGIMPIETAVKRSADYLRPLIRAQ